jgi:hypothetical protein
VRLTLFLCSAVALAVRQAACACSRSGPSASLLPRFRHFFSMLILEYLCIVFGAVKRVLQTHQPSVNGLPNTRPAVLGWPHSVCECLFVVASLRVFGISVVLVHGRIHVVPNARLVNLCADQHQAGASARPSCQTAASTDARESVESLHLLWILDGIGAETRSSPISIPIRLGWNQPAIDDDEVST